MALLPHEIATAHVLSMKLVAVADRFIDRAAVAPNIAVRIAATQAAGGLGNHFARLLRGVSRGALLMQALRDQGVTPAIVAPAPVPVRSAPSTAPKLHAAPGLVRGRLANGNPSGDFLAAPRCGAKTRAGCACRQPAMANGRCRLHGGKSTGPRTAAGLARSRGARLIHGGRSRAVITLRSQAAHSSRRLRTLLRAARPAGHGVDRSDRAAPVGATHPRVRGDKRGRPAAAGRPHGAAPTLDRAVAAGHGVDRSDSLVPAFHRDRLRSSTSVLATLAPAGYGVHRSVSC